VKRVAASRGPHAAEIEHQFAVIQGVAHTPWPLYDGLGGKCWAFYQEAFRMKRGR
jgi:hypothetical protein